MNEGSRPLPYCDNSRTPFSYSSDLTDSSVEIIDPSKQPDNKTAYNENKSCLVNKDNISARVSAASEDKGYCQSDVRNSKYSEFNIKESSADGYAYGGVRHRMEKTHCYSSGSSVFPKDCKNTYKKESYGFRSLIDSTKYKKNDQGNDAHGEINPYWGERGSPRVWGGHKDFIYAYPYEYVAASSNETMDNWQRTCGGDNNLYMQRGGCFTPFTSADASTGARWKYASDASTSTADVINQGNPYDTYSYDGYYTFPNNYINYTEYEDSGLYNFETNEHFYASSDHSHSAYGNLETHINTFDDSFYMGANLCYSPFVSKNTKDSRNIWEYKPVTYTSSISSINDIQNSYERNAYGDVDVSMENNTIFSPSDYSTNQNPSEMSTFAITTKKHEQNSNERDAYGNSQFHMREEYCTASNSLERADDSENKLQCKTDSRQISNTSNDMIFAIDGIKNQQNRLAEASSAIEPPEVDILAEKIQNAKLLFEELIDEDESLSKSETKKSEKIFAGACMQAANDPAKTVPSPFYSENVPKKIPCTSLTVLNGTAACSDTLPVFSATRVTSVALPVPHSSDAALASRSISVLHDSNTGNASTDLSVLSNTAATTTQTQTLLEKEVAVFNDTAVTLTTLSEGNDTAVSSIPKSALNNTQSISSFPRRFSNTKAASSSLFFEYNMSAGRKIALKPLSERRHSTSHTPPPIHNATAEIANPQTTVQNLVPNIFLKISKSYCLTVQEIIRRFPNTRNFLYKGYITIQPISSDERKEIIKFLDEQKEGYFLTEPPNEFPSFRVVIKGIGLDIPTDVLKQALIKKGFKVFSVWKLTHHRTEAPYSFYVTDVKKSANSSEIFNLKKCLHYKIKVEPYKSKYNYLQCFICCGFGHSPKDCDEI